MKRFRNGFMLAVMLLLNSAGFCGEHTYQLSVFSMFQNEGPYLKEWIEYYKMLGVDHFYLYNNNSEDNCQEILAPYIEQGDVELFNLERGEGSQGYAYFPQIRCIKDALERAKGVSKWLAVLDLDEWIFPTHGETITGFLQDYENENYGGIAINELFYGTSWVEKIPDNQLSIDHLVYRSEFDFAENHHIKCILRPERIAKCNNTHVFICHSPYHIVDENMNPIAINHLTPRVNVSKIRINHYFTRDEWYFHEKKIPRRRSFGPGDSDKGLIERNDRYYNVIFDDVLSQVHGKELYRRVFGED